MSNRFISKVFVAVCFVTVFTSCSKKQEEQKMGPMELPVSKVEKGNGLVLREYPASIQGVSDVEIRPQVSGYLQKILVDEGAYVRAGQALFKIDDRMYAEQYNTAKASVAVAKANLASVKIDLDRKKEMVNEKIVSPLQLQQAQASYDAAKAALNQAEANAQSARINYEFCTIKAPVSGYLGRINYCLGSSISVAGAQPLTILSDIHQVNVYFSMSELDYANFQDKYEGNTVAEKLKNSTPVGLELAGGKLYDLKGKIDAIEGQFNANTGTVSFRAKFDNPKAVLHSGNTGKIIIEQNYADVVLIPIASTYSIQDKTYMYTLDKENKAVQKPLEILAKTGTNYMVKSGVTAGETYVVSGFERLQTGMPVTPKNTSKDLANNKK